MEAVKNDIKNVLTSILSSVDDELKHMTKEELEQFYFFKWNCKKSIEDNIYEFHDLLNVYKSKCRRWEEIHNGSCYVVERVRDNYMLPKIKEFYNDLKKKNYTSINSPNE